MINRKEMNLSSNNARRQARKIPDRDLASRLRPDGERQMTRTLSVTQQLAAKRRPSAEGSLEATFEAPGDSAEALIKRLHEKDGPAEVLNFAGDELRRLDKAHRTSAMRPTLEIYTAALYLRENTDAWTEFCREEKWTTFRGKKPSPETVGNALRFAFRYAYGFDDPAATKRASKDARMLQSAFARRLTPAQAAAEVEAAGGKEAYSQAQQRARSDAAESTDPTITLVGGERLDGLAGLKPGRKMRLLFRVQQVSGATIVAKGLKINRVKGSKPPA